MRKTKAGIESVEVTPDYDVGPSNPCSFSVFLNQSVAEGTKIGAQG